MATGKRTPLHVQLLHVRHMLIQAFQCMAQGSRAGYAADGVNSNIGRTFYRWEGRFQVRSLRRGQARTVARCENEADPRRLCSFVLARVKSFDSWLCSLSQVKRLCDLFRELTWTVSRIVLTAMSEGS